MNYIKHLTGFFNRIALEKSLNPTHISLYLALFQCWNVNRFKNPIIISRDEMMKGSKIASKATYHKCIKELQRLKFLDYFPSYNPYSGTEVFMINFSEGNNFSQNSSDTTSSNNEQTTPIFEPTEPKNEHVNSNVAEQVIEPPYIYNNKQTLKNNKNIDRDTNFQNFDNVIARNEAISETEKEEKSSAKKEENFISPSIDLVKEYFKFQNFTEFEAERFFNYYSSIGWLIGGKTKMKDWQAAARNWMLNTPKFSINLPNPSAQKVNPQPRSYNLNATIDKNYAEPL
ncbi:transcriptional regulator [Flavobacterium luteum]|uniref:Transcriptional regulator n=1 Tax=Flavobacterium luteum TaxID=2026654 RepID=A0A7J5AJV3_9FLAO|nr:transcriptional regulator [Flavobacterium luteum]KAB1157773.1 transcriptional regulator [Flavobacterium luteum]